MKRKCKTCGQETEMPFHTCNRSVEPNSRRSFEDWISAPPYEHEVLRYPDDESKSAWPGQYKDIAVQLAWEARCEAANDRALLADFFAWCNGKTAEGTTVTIKGWPNMGQPAVEIWAADVCVGQGQTLLEAINIVIAVEAAEMTCQTSPPNLPS